MFQLFLSRPTHLLSLFMFVTNIVVQAQANVMVKVVRILLVKHDCAFGHHDKRWLLHKHIMLVINKNVCQAHVCVMAKLTNIVLDRQNFTCLPNNACSFDRGFNSEFQETTSFLMNIQTPRLRISASLTMSRTLKRSLAVYLHQKISDVFES